MNNGYIRKKQEKDWFLDDDQGGFTLIEVIVALSIIMIVLFAYTLFFTSSFEGIFRAGKKSEALFSAQEAIENLMVIRDAGDEEEMVLEFDGQEYKVKGRKLEADTMRTFVSEEKPLIRYVAVGNITKKVLTSPLGDEWEEYNSNVLENLNHITWGGRGFDKFFLAVGNNGTIIKSLNGRLWETVNHNSTSADLNAVTWGGIWGDSLDGMDGVLSFVAVGGYGNSTGSNYILHSEDGSNWSSPDEYFYDQNLNGVCWGFTGDDEGYFVAVGDNGRIVTSIVKDDTFSLEWEGIDTGNSEKLNDITWSNGIFAAVGDSGTILLSTNAQEWTIVSTDKKPANFNTNLNSITSNANIFVAVGDNGTILVSTGLSDETAWNEPTTVPGTTATLNAVTWSYNRFIAVGDGIIYTSVDGDVWIKIDPRQGDNWNTYNLKGITGR